MWLSYSGQVLICILGMSKWTDGCVQGSSVLYTCCTVCMACMSCPMHDIRAPCARPAFTRMSNHAKSVIICMTCEKWAGGAWGGVRDGCAVGQPAGSDDAHRPGQHPTSQRTLRQGLTCDEAEGGGQPPHCHPYLGPITPIMTHTDHVKSCPT